MKIKLYQLFRKGDKGLVPTEYILGTYREASQKCQELLPETLVIKEVKLDFKVQNGKPLSKGEPREILNPNREINFEDLKKGDTLYVIKYNPNVQGHYEQNEYEITHVHKTQTLGSHGKIMLLIDYQENDGNRHTLALETELTHSSMIGYTSEGIYYCSSEKSYKKQTIKLFTEAVDEAKKYIEEVEEYLKYLKEEC